MTTLIISLFLIFIGSYFVAYPITYLFFYINLLVLRVNVLDKTRVERIKKIHLQMNMYMWILAFFIMSYLFLNAANVW